MGAYIRFTPGVLATISVFIQFFVQFLLVKSLGILLLDMRDDFETDTWILGTVIGTFDCVTDLLAPIAGPLGKRFGHRPVIMCGGVLVTVGFVIGSQASSVLLLALSLILLIGPGYCVANVLARAALGKYFESKDFALAVGIAKTGSSVSLLVMPPLVQFFLDTYGWRRAMLLTGAVTAHLVVCGALLIPLPKGSGTSDDIRRDYQPLLDNQPPYSNRGILSRLKPFCIEVENACDLSLMKDFNFWIINILLVVTRITKSAWIIYFVPHAVAQGFTLKSASLMVTVAALGYLVSTVFVSVAVFMKKVTSTTAATVSTALMSASLFIDPLMKTGWLVSANGVLYMGAMASTFAMADVMMKEFLGFEEMANAYGWMGFFSGILRVSAGVIPGWVYDHSGSYDLAFVILGAMQSVSLVPLLIKRFCRSRDTYS